VRDAAALVVIGEALPLNCTARRRSRRRGRRYHRIEEGGGGLSRDHSVGHRVGVAFVRITGLTDPTLEVDPCTLLNDVGSLVGRGVQVDPGRERNVIPRRVRGRADRGGCTLSVAANVRAYATHIVVAEGHLDLVQVRQRSTRSRDS